MKVIQSKEQGSPVLDVKKEITSSGAGIGEFLDLLPPGVDMLI